jgi:hypothetical protein
LSFRIIVGVIYYQEHVTHCRTSAAYAARAALGGVEGLGGYDYLPFFYSRVFDLAWVFYGSADAGAREEATLAATDDGRTLFTVDITHPTGEGRDAQLAGGMAEGMQETHRRLEALIVQAQSS